MSTSNKVLFGTATVILSVIAISIVSLVIVFLQDDFFSGEKTGKSLPESSRDFAVGNFTSVIAGGVWQVEITRGETCRLRVTAPEKVLDFVKPEVSKAALSLEQVLGIDPRKSVCRAEIRMPSLGRIEVSGNSRVSFSGFEQKRMSIKATGAGQVKGEDSEITFLDCSADQTAVVDLSGCTVTSSDFNASFAAKITLRVAGGTLKGKVAASAVFSYIGEPLEMEIESAGSAKIRKVKNP